MIDMYQQKQQIVFSDYKQIVAYHIALVSRASSNIMNVDEKSIFGGTDPREVFILAVETLESLLAPKWDNDYKTARDKAHTAGDKYRCTQSLLQACILLALRQKVITDKEDIEIEE